MVAKIRTAFRILIIWVVLALFMPQLSAAQAQGATYTSPETGKTVRGAFLRYWLTGGAALRYGNPISNEVQETSDLNGKIYTMQYFERATFEAHPDNPIPYDILLSHLGVFLYNAKYPNGAPGQMASNTPDSFFFSETGKHIGCQFLAYWSANGGLMRFGYPISDELIERSEDGSPVRVQYFQRTVLKYDNDAIAHFDSDRGYVIAPGIGTEAYNAKHSPTPVTLPTPIPTQASGPSNCAPTAHGPSYSDNGDIGINPPVRASVGKGVVVSGSVRSSNGCNPLANASVIYWLAGLDGEYDSDHEGKVFTDSNGRYTFETNFPGFYGAGGPHVHLYVDGPAHQGMELEIFVACGQTEGSYDVVLAPER